MSYDLSVPATLIAERMGLHFQENRWPDLMRGLERAAVTLGFDDVHRFIAHLLADHFGQREMQALATHLTIGETYFFRTPETFSMLETKLLPELVSAHQHTDRTLRIWSAGCATGQEAYSLAIVMSRLLPKRSDWDITILATDINPQALATAQAAEYTQWSFRDTPAWVTNGYFTSPASGRFRVDPAIRDMVTFRPLNLAENTYPSVATGLHDFDLILCRNVIMYFSREVAQQVADRLQKSVRDGGYLVVTASEGSRDFHLPATVTGGEIVYQKTAAAASVESPGTREKASVSEHNKKTAQQAPKRHASNTPDRHNGKTGSRSGHTSRQAARGKAARGPVVAAPPASQQVDRRREGRPFAAYAKQKAAAEAAVRGGNGTAEPNAAALDPLGTAKEARRLADRGQLAEALSLCETALGGDKLSPTLYYLKASILQELGRSDEAEQALQSTLFLDGDFAMARVMLGAIARGQSRSNEAAKYFRAALAQLEQMPYNAVLPETEGLTAGEMAEMVAALMGSES